MDLSGGRPEPRGRLGVIRRRGGLLREHDFRLLWIGETTSALGTNVSRLALPLVAVVDLQANAFQLSLLTAAAWLPWLLIGLPAGAWVDRWARRPVLLVSDGVSLVLLLTVPLAAWAGVLTLTQLLIVALLVGTAAVFFQTAYQVYLPDLVPTEDLPEANAKLFGSESAAQVAGPGLAGLITQALGAVGGLLFDACSFAVSAGCLLRIRRGEPEPATSAPAEPAPAEPAPAEPAPVELPVVLPVGLGPQIAAGMRFVLADPYLCVLTVSGALSNLALTGYQCILVLFLFREVGADSATVGILMSGMSVGGLLGASTAARIGRRLGTARGTLVSNLAAGPCAMLIPLAGPGCRSVLVVAGGLGVGVAVVAGNVLRNSFRQAYTPRALQGRVVVSMSFVNYGTIPLGALLGGTLATALGLRTTVWIMVVGVLLASSTLLIGPLKRDRDFPDHPASLRP